ncbi:TolC family protein [Bdellovibrio reynosensis]|uniref:TolC family protein n=1 Tax=Bdellovibrio reynosensis TaxID=2835041 RepID=A0ABY4CAF1_9BACT|nr:TolC family protein [Bdellovibrio reynosensis]UOF01902.1 TolC family protein [Bdellovibrio reynosensis]
MVRLLTVLFAILIPSAAFAQTVVVSSKNLRTLVETRNERVKAKEFEYQSAKLKVGSWARSYLPTLELYGAQESFKKGTAETKSQPTYGAALNMNLYNGGQDKLTEARHELASERKSYEKAVTLAEQLSEAQAIYWDILYRRDYLILVKQAQELNATNLKSAVRRIQSGVATETDRIEFEMRDIELKQILDEATLAQKNQINMLKLFLGYEEEASLQFSESLEHDHDWQGLIQHSEKNHDFLIKPVELLSEELKIEGKARQRYFLPKLEAYAAYNQFNQREEDPADEGERQETVIGLRLTMNLFDGFKSQRESSALKAEAQAIEMEARFKKRELDLHLHAEMEELNLLHGQVHDAEQNIKHSEKYFKLTQSEYARGVKNSPDMLSASEKLFATQVKMIEIIKKFQVAKAHLLAKLGK